VNAVINAVKAQTLNADILTSMPEEKSTSNPRTEVDSHANMVVLGKDAFVFESSGRKCNVRPFSDELGIATDVPIVDGAMAYDCPFSGSHTYCLSKTLCISRQWK